MCFLNKKVGDLPISDFKLVQYNTKAGLHTKAKLTPGGHSNVVFRKSWDWLILELPGGGSGAKRAELLPGGTAGAVWGPRRPAR